LEEINQLFFFGVGTLLSKNIHATPNEI